MARPLRVYDLGIPQHVMARGNNKAPIFVDDHDRASFCEGLKKVLERYHWVCHAYCLMDNHYHLVIEPRQPTLDRGMKVLNSSYVQRFNKRHGRSGHLFGGRYRSISIEDDTYFLEVCRYVVRNPIKAGLCSRPDQWRWSSYRATAGTHKDGLVPCSNDLLSRFGTSLIDARRRYRSFIDEDEIDVVAHVTGERLGVPTKGCTVDPKNLSPEIPERQRNPARTALPEIFAREDHPYAAAYRTYGYRLREIAGFIGCHYTTVSKRLKQEEQSLDSDQHVQISS